MGPCWMNKRDALQTTGNEEMNVADPVVASLTAARSSVDRLVRLTDLLFDVALARFGTLEVRPTLCDLAEVVAEQMAVQRLAAGSRAIHLERPDQSVPILGDVDRLGQVLANYISNALKYSADDQPVDVFL